MSERAMQLVQKALSTVALEELVLSQVKRQIDDSTGDGKPFLPLWADRVGFKETADGSITMVNDPLVRKARGVKSRSGIRKFKARFKKTLAMLRSVRGKMKRVARLVARSVESSEKRYARLYRGAAARYRRASFIGPRPSKAKWRDRMHYSYRRGGKPLLDTRQGYAAVNAHSMRSGTTTAVTINAPAYMVYQHKGFVTKGPNFIPLSLLAKRTHKTGMNPKDEGLKRGIDYWIFHRGVSVPARPFAKLGSKYLHRLARSLYLDLRAQNNG